MVELEKRPSLDLPTRAKETLELAKSASRLFSDAPGDEKRQFLRDVISNSVLDGDGLRVEFLQPFGLIADTNDAWREKKAAGFDSSDLHLFWYPRRDSNPCTRLRRPVLYPAELRGHRRSEVSDSGRNDTANGG